MKSNQIEPEHNHHVMRDLAHASEQKFEHSSSNFCREITRVTNVQENFNENKDSKEQIEFQKTLPGHLFSSRLLYEVDKDCNLMRETDKKNAVERIMKYCKVDWTQAMHLCEAGVKLLQSSRLTMNFRLQDFDCIILQRYAGQLVNCFEFSSKPREPCGYNLGRARHEEKLFKMDDLFVEDAMRKIGKYESATNAGIRSKYFLSVSRPLYGALDFLCGKNGGAACYGKSYLIFKEYVKQRCSYAPVDTYSSDILGRDSVSFNKLSSFYHMERLIAYMQEDRFGYNCFSSFIDKLQGKIVSPHKNYGLGGRNNYIDTQIHMRPIIQRDVKNIMLSREELYMLSDIQQRRIEDDITALNAKLGYGFIQYV